MDESVLYPNVEVRIPMSIPEGAEREELAKDPARMLSISMSRRERLPDELHTAMVMWSFHPEKKSICKFYFDWVEACEHKEKTGSKFFDFFETLKEKMSWMMSSARR